jgi:hypothetical protein
MEAGHCNPVGAPFHSHKFSFPSFKFLSIVEENVNQFNKLCTGHNRKYSTALILSIELLKQILTNVEEYL